MLAGVILINIYMSVKAQRRRRSDSDDIHKHTASFRYIKKAYLRALLQVKVTYIFSLLCHIRGRVKEREREREFSL